MKLEDLVGFQLVDINESHIIVANKNKEYVLNIDEDSGDCCGFNEIQVTLHVSDSELERNPVITNIEREVITNDYPDGDWVKITFFGELKSLATLDSYSSSGSGWHYGACVSIKCKAIDLDEVITEW